MRNLFWVLVLFAGIGLGGVSAWYLVNAESADVSGSSQPDLEQPRLITDPSRADSSHIPAGEIVDQAIEDTTQAQRLPGSPDPVETTIEIIEAPVGAVADVLGVAGGKDAIAVLPFKMMGGTNSFNKDTGNILCDAFVSEIDSQEYEIFERLQLKSLLEEKGFQASSLVDSPTGAVRFGRLCKVRYIVLGSIASLGGQYHLSGRVVDCATGKVGRRGWVVFSSMTQWASKVPELVNLLALRRGSAGSTGPAYQGNQLVNTVNANANFAVSLSTVQQKQTYLEGEYIKFVVSAEKDCFVTLITVDSAGEMTLLLPNNWQRRAFVRRNTKLTIPSDEMGFRFPIQPPHGETIVKAIATLQPLTLSGVNAKSIDQQKFVTLSRGVKAIGVEGANPASNGCR